MCGICGITYRDPSTEVDEHLVRNMNDTMVHRGPDGQGVWRSRNLGFGHRRLSIIDLSDNGLQPMHSKDGQGTLTFNGEVYNFGDLKSRFLPNHEFTSTTDSEVVLELLTQKGSDAIALFEGMFALAFYHKGRQELILARDHFGIKPLFYSLRNESLVFGSELKAVMASGVVSNQLDHDALNDYFDFSWIPEPRTIYKEVRKLERGQILKLNLSTWDSELKTYWQPTYAPIQSRSISQWIDDANQILEQSVNEHLVADVRVGSFLSGGIDSALVTSAANARSEISAFTVDFDEVEFSEAEFAKTLAKKIGLKNHYCSQAGSAELGMVDSLVEYYDEPFSDSSMIPTFLVCQQARKKFKVCLSGDGGDELFAGYAQHRVSKELEKLKFMPNWIMSSVFGMANRFTANNLWWYEWTRRLSHPSRTRALTLARLPANKYRLELLGDDYRKTDDSRFWVIDKFANQIADLPPVTRSQIFDILFYLPNDMLTKVDRASMANSLEVRVPLLVKKVSEFAFSIPDSQRFYNNEQKYILRRLMERKFGAQHASRKKKGFSIPLVKWIQSIDSTKFQESVLGSGPMKHGVLNKHAILKNIETVNSSQKNAFEKYRAATNLFSALVFNSWWKCHYE